ncbi:MAG: hypothetical protein M3T56_14320 [Chloroflexota bacterium]|nr:hypothetical protein [Chloroflexota bacterium]
MGTKTVTTYQNEPMPRRAASRYLASDDLDRLLLNRYPGRGDELRGVLSERWRVRPDQLILGGTLPSLDTVGP